MMNPPLLITIGLSIFILGVTVAMLTRNRTRAKAILGGLGWLGITVGLYLFGFTNLIYNGVLSLIDWAQRTVWSDTMTFGASILGGGVLLLVMSAFLKSKPLATPPAKPAKPGADQKTPAKPQQQAALPETKKSADPVTPPTSADEAAADAEIEELLRKRGIN